MVIILILVLLLVFLNILICLLNSEPDDLIAAFPYFTNVACLFRGAGDVHTCLLSAKAIFAPQVTLKL